MDKSDLQKAHSYELFDFANCQKNIKERVMFVMLTQDLKKGFSSWKNMFLENEAAFKALGGTLIFAGPERDDDNKMLVIIEFESADSMKAFATHEELRAKRAAAGAVLESNVITHLGDESFTGT